MRKLKKGDRVTIAGMSATVGRISHRYDVAWVLFDDKHGVNGAHLFDIHELRALPHRHGSRAKSKAKGGK